VQPTSPTKIGKYDVEERVGEGAMGVVYRALDPVLKRRVAIKVMSEAFAQNDDLRERFLREAQAAGSLQHPNVITIYDFGEVSGHLYIAMEFVEGQDVAELLAHQAPLSLAAKLDIAIGVLQGLAFAHKRGIVHRDIKPANIRVDADGNARIMDFGVAHFASSNMTRTGVMIGTPSYMAPEQITSATVGPQSDIFSLGAVLYELLTGIGPFAGGSLQAVMYRVLSETPAAPGTLVSGLPPKVNDIVLRALAKEPAQRYASSLDMANELLAVRASLDERPSSPGTLSLRATIESALDERRTSAFKAVRRRRFAFGGGGIAAAVILVLSGWLLARRTAPSPSAAPAPTVTDERRPDSTPKTTAAAPSTAAPAPEQPRVAQQPATQTPAKDRAPVSAPAPKAGRSQLVAADTAATVKPIPNPSQQQAKTTQTAPSSGTGARAEVTPAGTAQPIVVSPPPVAAPTPSAPPNTSPASSSSVDPAATNAATSNAASASANNAAAAAEISGVIDAYARAIESRDIAELRRVYPAMTGDQAAAFGDFFKLTRALHAALAVKSSRIDGNRGTAHVAGTYEFTTSAGRNQQQQVTFDAELRRDAGSWKLVAIR
jgi:serine/threonine protein kinase